MTALALLPALRFSGWGQYLSMVGMIFAVVTAYKLRGLDPSRRFVLVIVPAVVAPILFIAYLLMPHGATGSNAAVDNNSVASAVGLNASA